MALRDYYKIFLTTLLLQPSMIAMAQEFYVVDDIPVSINDVALTNALAGGVLAPQFGTIDADFDGDQDLAVFDRYNDRLLIFENTGNDYSYKPALSEAFPPRLDNWIMFRDFNADGKKDLFVSTSLGMEVYVNTGSEEKGLTWRKYHDRGPAPSPLLTQGFNSLINLQLNATDIPSIDDIDQDGDLDILVFRFAGGSTVELHRNYAMERSGNSDSLQLERVTSAWGGFRECLCGTFAFGNEDCPPISGRPAHEGGKTLLTIDLDGDGDRDAMVSEETCDDIFPIQNDGTLEEAEFTTVLDDYLEGVQPFFPAAFYEDLNFDGIKDLVIASNWPDARTEFTEVVNFYRNDNAVDNPEFVKESNRFLIETMVDVGSLSYPAFFDIDNDGDQDMLLGSYKGEGESIYARIQFYENNGSRSSPDFELADDDYLSLSSGQYMLIRPRIVDLTGDGLPDMCFSALKEGLGHRLYIIQGGDNSFTGTPTSVFSDLGEQDVLSIWDQNKDGVPDLLVGRVTGTIDLYLGQQDGNKIGFSFERSGIYGLGADSFRGATYLIADDLNGDGREDLIRADSRGGMAWLESADENLNWEDVLLFNDSLRTGAHLPGRDLAPSAVDLFALDRNQLVLGSGSGGIQVLRPFDAIEEPPSEQDVVIFPNPVFNDLVKVRTSEPARIEIRDMAGRLIRVYDAAPSPVGDMIISTETWGAGMYIISAVFGNGRRVSKRIVIIH